jgi:protein phosphatase
MDHARGRTAAERLKWYGRTDVGKVRRNNEDAFLGVQFDGHEVRHLGRVGESGLAHGDLVFAVSDGMGGAKSGEFASRIAVDKITTLLPKSFQQSAEGLDAGFADVLTELYDRIHRALVYVGGSYEECYGMEATLSLCWFTPGWMYFAHIGDSRIYYLPKGGGIKQLSHDDTHVGWLFRNGHINEREARNHPRRNVLQKALGGGNQFVDPQVGSVGYEPGDMFLLCSDGLSEGLYPDQMLDFLRNVDYSQPGPNPAYRLVDESLARDGRDNTTALVIEVG